MEAISRSCLPEAAARTKRQRKATCCGVLGAASLRTTCSRSSAAKLTSGLILAMRTHISYWPQYVYLFMIHTTSVADVLDKLPDRRNYSTVRAQLRVLEEKRLVRHETKKLRYLYAPTVPRQIAQRSALRHMIETFFDGSVENSLATILTEDNLELL